MQAETNKKMKERYFPYLFLPLFVLTFFLLNCGGIVPSPKLNPEVKHTSPSDTDQDVLVGNVITVTFSKEMDLETITDTTFFLKKTGDLQSAEAGTISKNSTAATLDPNNPLAPSTDYIVVVTTDVKDLSGKAIVQEHSWTFKTAAAGGTGGTGGTGTGGTGGGGVDTTPPTVVSVFPLDGATNIPIDQVITVTFSEDIIPTTVTLIAPKTFNIDRGAKGSLDFPAGNMAAFIPNPLTKLKFDRLYTVTITGAPAEGIKDLAGNVLDPTFTWSFRTAGDPDEDDGL